jgi:drug/metabolite transporter (DMT)-like permease
VRHHRFLGIACVLGAVLAFSSSSTIIKWSDAAGPSIAFWRMLFSAVLWWLVLIVRRAVKGRPLPSRRSFRVTVPAGICFGLNITLFFTAITRTSIAHAEFITALSPLLLVPAGVIFFGERPDAKALSFGLITLAGLGIVLFAGGSATEARWTGDAIVAGVVLLWVGYLLTGRRARAEVDVADFMTIVMTAGFVVAAPLAFVIAGDDFWPMPAKGWFAAGLLAVMTGMLAHGLIAFAQREVDVATIGILQVSQPALAVGWAYLLIGESIVAAQVPGMVLVIAGLAAFTLVSQRRARAAEAAAVVEATPAGVG